MTRNRYSVSAKHLAIAAISLLIITSCKKDDNNDNKPANYIGVWVTEKTVDSDDGSIEIKDVINFQENSFTETASMKDDFSGGWIDVVGRKGTFTVKSDKMNVTINKIGYTSVDEDGWPTGDLEFYDENTDEFDDLLDNLEMKKDYVAVFTVKDDKLTLKADEDGDGSYDDDEVNVYTRK